MRSYGHPHDDQSPHQSRQKLIWTVDDEHMITELYRRALPGHLFRVVPFNDATLVMDAFKVERPDLILLDLKMPGCDGLTLYRYIKQDPDTKDIPVIIVSGYLSDDACEAMDNRDYVVSKSEFEITRFLELINDIFGINGAPPGATQPPPPPP